MRPPRRPGDIRDDAGNARSILPQNLLIEPGVGSCIEAIRNQQPEIRNPRVYACRASGGHHDHWHPDRVVAAGRAGGPRGGQEIAVHEQPQATRPGDAQPRTSQWLFPSGGWNWEWRRSRPRHRQGTAGRLALPRCPTSSSRPCTISAPTAIRRLDVDATGRRGDLIQTPLAVHQCPTRRRASSIRCPTRSYDSRANTPPTAATGSPASHGATMPPTRATRCQSWMQRPGVH